jgi:hypothetical protein
MNRRWKWTIVLAVAAFASFWTQPVSSQETKAAVLSKVSHAPRFEDYPVTIVFKGTPAAPILKTPEERLYRTVIRQGVSKGYGVFAGSDGKESPGPNFAGHYFIITWGCGSPCLMAAIVDAKTGRVYPPPFHDSNPGHVYFQVPWQFPERALDYRLDSRLLVTNLCEVETVFHTGNQISYRSDKCGPHYFVMSENGLALVYRVLE